MACHCGSFLCRFSLYSECNGRKSNTSWKNQSRRRWKGELKAIADKKKAVEAAAEAEELEKNLENAKYLRKIVGTIAEIRCKDAIEEQAEYDFEWTERLFKFPSYLVKTKAPGILTLVGDKIKMQTPLGAMRFMKYHCDYDVRDKEVLAVRVFPR